MGLQDKTFFAMDTAEWLRKVSLVDEDMGQMQHVLIAGLSQLGLPLSQSQKQETQGSLPNLDLHGQKDY